MLCSIRTHSPVAFRWYVRRIAARTTQSSIMVWVEGSSSAFDPVMCSSSPSGSFGSVNKRFVVAVQPCVPKSNRN